MPLVTVETKKSVNDFVNSLKDEGMKKDCKKLVTLISGITGEKAKIWGTIIGFGKYKYKRKGSKEELEWFNVGFAPRKDRVTLYFTCYLENEPLVKKLGKCKHGKGCLHIRRLEDIDIDVLKKLIEKYKDNRWYGGN